MTNTVVAVLEPADADKLMELEAARRALPLEYGKDLYYIARGAQYDLIAFQARMIDKYVAPGRTISEFEELYGDYGYDFDPVAGTITRDDG
jgi:hypothetical protein